MGNRTNKGCCLCAQIGGESGFDLLHKHLGGDAYRRRLAELGGDWYAIPSLGALVPGHTLLCPARHTRSFASLSVGELGEMEPRLTQLTSYLSARFNGAMQLFEHGNARDGSRVACSVEHAHLHLVPGAPDLWPFIDRSINWEPLVDGLAGLAPATGGGEYLLYRDLNSDCWIAEAPEHGHPSQVMRRALAAAIGEPEQWNWRIYPRLRDTIVSTEAVIASV
jgi:diadenosine tetraphosphate (Ap4A) HIT family hydrolase